MKGVRGLGVISFLNRREPWRGTVVSRSKGRSTTARHSTNPMCCPSNSLAVAGRRRERTKAASSCKWTDRRRKSFQTWEAALKARMALKRAFPILHVGVLDVEEGQSEV